MSSTARGKREPGVGDHVVVGGKKGVIQFSGETQFASGKWVGVHLEKPEGKNDGSVQGVIYFTCPPNHGLFVKSSMAKLDPDWKETPTVRTTASPSPTPSDTLTSSASPALTGIRAPSPQIVPISSPSAASIPASLLVTPAKPPTAADPTPTPQSSVATPSLVEKQSVLKQAEEKRAALKEKQPDAGARRPSVLEDDAARAASPAPTSIRAPSPAPTTAATSTSSAQSTATSAATAAELAKAHAEAMANAKAHADALAQAAVYRDEIVSLKTQLNDATTQVTTLKQESAKLKAELTKANTESDEVAELKLMIETLTLDKDLAEETVEESKTEIATLNARMEALTKELEDVRAQRQQAHTQFLETLPADKADQAKLVDQNQQLAVALKQLHDVSVTEKNKSTSIIARMEKELEVLRANQTELENLRKLTKQQSTQISELKEALDEASEHEAMVEVLSEKNLQLGEQIKEMEKSMTYQQSLITASEEVEEGHVEFEQQLQRELDAKESELHELYGKLKYKTQQLDEMNKSIRQFRELTKHLENELEEIRRQQSTHTNRNASTSQETRGTSSLQLSRGLLEMKKKTVASHLAKLEAEQAKRKAELVQAYLPENISVDEHSHSLLLLIDRLRSKYSILQQLLHESYGYGTHMSITSDDPQEQQLIMVIYHVCNMMMDHVRGMEYITYGLQRTPVETYNLAASRHKDLLTLEPLLDTWFTQISNDTVHATTSLQPLYDAYPTILKYMMIIFNGTLSLPPTYDVGHVTPITEKMRSEYTLSDKHLPTPLTIVIDAQQLQYHSYGIRIPMQHMGDILTSMQSAIKQGRAALPQKENKNDADDTAIATAAGVDVDDLSSSQILFNKLEDIQITIQSLCQQLLTNAKSYEVIASSHRKTSVIDPGSLIEPFTTVHAHMTSTIHRLVTLHTSIRAILSREQIMEWSRGRGLDDVDSVTSRIDTVLSPEVKENTGVLHDLQRLKTEINDLSKKLVGHDTEASTVLSASTTAAAHLTTVSAPYEAHATAIRQQLQQAASMRVALQEAQQRMAEKTRELFTVKTQNQENAAKIEALQSKLKLLQGRAESTTDLRTELEAYKKRDTEVKQAMEVLNADLDKYSNDNKALRKQLVKVKYTLKQMEQQKQNEATTAPTAGSKSLLTSAKDLSNMQTASEQIELLQRTIRMLRQALAQERATRQIHVLTHELPPLLNVRTALAPASHQRVQDPVEPPKAIPSIPHPFTTSTPASSTSTLAAITGMIAGTNTTTGVAGTSSQPQPRTHRLGSLIAADLASSVPVHHVPIPDDRTIMQQLAQQLTTLKKQVTLYRAAPTLVDLTSLQQQQQQREEIKSKEAADADEKKQTIPTSTSTTLTPSQYHSDRSRAYAYQLAATKLQLEIEQISRKIRVSRLHAASSTTQALPTVPATPAPVTEKLIGKLTAPAPITFPTPTSDKDKKTPTPPLPSKLLLQRQQLLELHAMLLK